MASGGPTTRDPGVMGLTVAVSVAGPLPVYMAGALAVFVRSDLRFDEAALGAAVSGFFLASALASIPGGRLVEAVGPFRGMAVGTALTTTAALAMAAVASSYWHVAAVLAIAGLGNAVIQPSSNVAITVSVPVPRQGLAFGVKQAAGPGCALLAGLAVPVIGLTIGWRWAFGLLGILAMVLTRVCLGRGAGGTRAGGARGRITGGRRHLYLLCVVNGFGAASLNSIGSFYVSSAVELQRLEEGVAGMAFALGGLAGVVGRVAAGWVADRLDGRRFVFVAVLQVAGGIGAALLSITGSPVLLAIATALAFLAGWGWQGVFNFLVVRRYPEAPGAATALTNTGLFLGGVIGPALFGLMAERVSYSLAWQVAGAWMLTSAVLSLVSRRHKT